MAASTQTPPSVTARLVGRGAKAVVAIALAFQLGAPIGAAAFFSSREDAGKAAAGGATLVSSLANNYPRESGMTDFGVPITRGFGEFMTAIAGGQGSKPDVAGAIVENLR